MQEKTYKQIVQEKFSQDELKHEKNVEYAERILSRYGVPPGSKVKRHSRVMKSGKVVNAGSTAGPPVDQLFGKPSSPKGGDTKGSGSPGGEEEGSPTTQDVAPSTESIFNKATNERVATSINKAPPEKLKEMIKAYEGMEDSATKLEVGKMLLSKVATGGLTPEPKKEDESGEKELSESEYVDASSKYKEQKKNWLAKPSGSEKPTPPKMPGSLSKTKLGRLEDLFSLVKKRDDLKPLTEDCATLACVMSDIDPTLKIKSAKTSDFTHVFVEDENGKWYDGLGPLNEARLKKLMGGEYKVKDEKKEKLLLAGAKAKGFGLDVEKYIELTENVPKNQKEMDEHEKMLEPILDALFDEPMDDEDPWKEEDE
jgi:hypothetical protein